MSVAATPTQVDLYWRPGCMFCISLTRQLDKMRIPRVEHNIWDDDSAAKVVRHHADGHETVPTVVIGDIGLVNPRASDVLAVLDATAPHLVPDDVVRPEASRFGRVVDRLRRS